MTGGSSYLGASQCAIRDHYDIGNDFFRLWLDSSMTYSCAMWENPTNVDDDTLEAAQQRKHDLLIDGTSAAGRSRVLDVGCGWGALMRRLIDHHGVDYVTGLTLSSAQAESIAEWADERISVRVENWVDHSPSVGYDAIISIGAFEHFADMGLRRHERVAAYRQFFMRCCDWLPSRGRLGLQTMVKGNNIRMNRQTVKDLLFMIDCIFRESEVPWLSEIFEASERLFDCVWLRNDADHYARTTAEWYRRMLAHRERAAQLIGSDVVAEYERYLNAASDAFTRRHFGLARMIFERV